MALVKLWDREEGELNGQWFLREEICVTCPICSTWTDAVITGPTITDYVHELGPQGSQCTLPNHAVPNFLHNAFQTLQSQRLARSCYLDPWEGDMHNPDENLEPPEIE